MSRVYLNALLVVFWLAGLYYPGAMAAAVWSVPQAEHAAVLFILDDSGSMKGNDPSGLRYAAAGMFISALDPGDRVGALRFATQAQTITEGFVELHTQGDKLALINQLQPVVGEGYTDVRAAFTSAQPFFQSLDLTGYRPLIVFLTDGTPESPDMCASYLDETLALARDIGAPVYAVALTPGGQTSFLVNLAQETGGQVFTARGAADLLDRFLQILSDLKDRTVVGQGQTGAPGEVAVSLDPALTPYIREVTFIIAHSPGVTTRLAAPGGSEISSVDMGVFRIDDPRFSAVSVPTPQGGDWLVRLEGSGSAQVRAIFHSRLRARVVSPTGWVESGQPAPLVVNLLEEQPNGQMVKIVGDAGFSARITLPDGSQESLDQFYDDGTHGDKLPGDGNFTRMLVNTHQPGSYSISLRGQKGPVSVSAEVQFEAVALPTLVVDAPQPGQYDIRTEPIPLSVHLEGVATGQFEGGFKAVITSPGGQINDVSLIPEGNSYVGVFLPVEDGAHTVTFTAENSAFLGLPYQREAQSQFTARIVPTVSVVSARFASDTSRYEVEEARAGLPLEVTFRSTASKPVHLIASLDGLPGFQLAGSQMVDVMPGNETRILTQLVFNGKLESTAAHSWQGRLRFEPAPDSSVDLVDAELPLEFETYTPAITLAVQTVSQCEPGKCWQWQPVQLIIHAESTSLKTERLDLTVDGLPASALDPGWIEVPPGSSETRIVLHSLEGSKAGVFNPGEYRGWLIVSEARKGVIVAPTAPISVEFVVSSPLQSCRNPLIFSGIGALGLAIIIFKVASRARSKAQPPVVKGTLVHWPKNAPDRQETVDLTALNKEGVTIGTGSHCDVIIADSSMAETHAKLYAERMEGDEIRYMLSPQERVVVGYRPQTTSFELRENVSYQMGERIFKYVRDIEL